MFMPSKSILYLIPSFLSEASVDTIPVYIIESIKNCKVIFAENERTARRFFKALCKEIVIDDYEWHTIDKEEADQVNIFRQKITENKNIAIISEGDARELQIRGSY